MAHRTSNDVNIPHQSSLDDHNSMYRRRAKLRDILRIVDRHSTGALSRQKFHMCLQLADLPRPDRKMDSSLYGAYYTKDTIRYGDFLEALKYDTSYRNFLMGQWRSGLGQTQVRPKGMPMSLTPEPRGLPRLQPPNKALMLPIASRAASRASAQSGGSKWQALLSKLSSMDRGGVIPIEQLQQALSSMHMVPPGGSNKRLMDLLAECDQGGGDIDYRKFVAAAQRMEQQNDPIFVSARGSMSRQSNISAVSGGGSAKAKREQLRQTLNSKHRAVLDALNHADQNKTGKIELGKLKNSLQQLGVVTNAQLHSGELDCFFNEFEGQGGEIDYKSFAHKIKAEDMKQLESMTDDALRNQHLK